MAKLTKTCEYDLFVNLWWGIFAEFLKHSNWTTVLISFDSSENWMSRRARRENGEDDSLSSIAREAEARLAAKRAARAEAREIRLKELEKQQREVNTYYCNHYRNVKK